MASDVSSSQHQSLVAAEVLSVEGNCLPLMPYVKFGVATAAVPPPMKEDVIGALRLATRVLCEISVSGTVAGSPESSLSFFGLGPGLLGTCRLRTQAF